VTASGADTSLLGPVFACLLIMIVSYLILQRVPEIAARWGDGVSAGIQELVPNNGGGGSRGGGALRDGGQKGSAGAGGGSGAKTAAATAAGGPGAGAASAATSQMQGFAKGSRR
ncbi:TPA: hypothetical protein R8G42_005350, partial [Citrobacter freundii]|nr:hypothetical protein [Citrobacter freundii]